MISNDIELSTSFTANRHEIHTKDLYSTQLLSQGMWSIYANFSCFTRVLRPWSTIECSQPAAWTTNRSLLVASRARLFQEVRPIPARPYPELRTWMVMWSGIISLSPRTLNVLWHLSTCLPNTSSIPAPIQPTIAMTTTHIHQLWLTRSPSTRSSSASEDHPQAPVVTQQQQREFSGYTQHTHNYYNNELKCIMYILRYYCSISIVLLFWHCIIIVLLQCCIIIVLL